MRGTCNWCNAIVQAPENYDRTKMRLFCSSDCAQKDWLFRRWQNDEWLTYLADKRRRHAKGNKSSNKKT